MILDGHDFGRVWNASGARGFCGEGYRHHRFLRPFGLSWSGSTFVAKTCTYKPHDGNMPLDGLRPRDRWPDCIRVDFPRGVVLNAVGLSNPGLEYLLRTGLWQQRKDPFVLSFAAIGRDRASREFETWAFSEILTGLLGVRSFRAPVALQVNGSCGNVNHDGFDLEEVIRWLDILAERLPGIPLIPKISPLVPWGDAQRLAHHPKCRALVVGNTIPWRVLEERERQGTLDAVLTHVLEEARAAFGGTSPLVHLGGGGISGRPLLPVVARWMGQALVGGFPVPIVAGGGILSAGDAGLLLRSGAAAVELGSVAILRPWRVRGIIRDINRDGNRLGDWRVAL